MRKNLQPRSAAVKEVQPANAAPLEPCNVETIQGHTSATNRLQGTAPNAAPILVLQGADRRANIGENPGLCRTLKTLDGVCRAEQNKVNVFYTM